MAYREQRALRILLPEKECTGCAACVSLCSARCITMRPDAEGFLRPMIDYDACLACGSCRSHCPALHPKAGRKDAAVYAAYSRDAQIRQESSSGGVFTELAREVLREHGVIFGAAFDRDFSVRHQAVTDERELWRLRQAKYVQSRIGDTYQQAVAYLEQGRLVLFTGTPCQIAGLQASLSKPYENLICQDVICHGVPSPKAWERYLEARERKAGARVIDVSFRDKRRGWEHYTMALEFANGTRYAKQVREDPMLVAFLQNICLRPSCHSCAYKGFVWQSDVTLADFWGIERILPKLDDHRGVSMVLVHTEKGKQLWAQLQERLVCKEVSEMQIQKHNPAAITAAAPGKNRERFLQALEELPFDAAVRKYCGIPLWKQIGRGMKNFGKKNGVHRLERIEANGKKQKS